jgi:hypothetical protein
MQMPTVGEQVQQTIIDERRQVQIKRRAFSSSHTRRLMSVRRHRAMGGMFFQDRFRYRGVGRGPKSGKPRLWRQKSPYWSMSGEARALNVEIWPQLRFTAAGA